MRLLLTGVAAIALAVAGCSNDPLEPIPATSNDSSTAARVSAAPLGGRNAERVVVANRGSGTISVINSKSNEVVGTFDLPADMGESTPEPMYVVHTKRWKRVFVGDRANNRVVAFDDRTYEVEGTAPAGAGVFHMWADPFGRQLWVNNDVENTTSVIDPHSMTVIATVPTPADLVASGGKPHDVIVGPSGDFAYVSVLNVAGDSDYVVQFDTSSFEEVGRAAVGKDPHLSLARQHNRLYVPCQNSNVVIVLNRYNLELITTIDVPGAHGAGMSKNGHVFYTANLPGGGTNALFTIDTNLNEVIGMPTDSPFPVPHNIALTTNNRRLFLTHSGATADKVTVYGMNGGHPVPQYLDEITVGLNPFGVALVK